MGTQVTGNLTTADRMGHDFSGTTINRSMCPSVIIGYIVRVYMYRSINQVLEWGLWDLNRDGLVQSSKFKVY